MLLTFFLSFEFSISEYLSFCLPFFLYSRRILADIEQNIEFRKDFTRVNYVVSSFLSFSIALSMLLTFFLSSEFSISEYLSFFIHAEYWPISSKISSFARISREGYVSITLSHRFFHFRSLYQCFLHSFVRRTCFFRKLSLFTPNIGR